MADTIGGVRRFELEAGTSRKFWEIGHEGRQVTVRFGRLGTDGQEQVKHFESDRAALAHVDKMIAAKTAKGYVERPRSGPMTSQIEPATADSAISVQRGVRRYMSERSDACHVLVRRVDDIDAATRALRAFRQDLWTSDLFASLDGEFGNDIDGTPIRYTPSYASEVEVGPDGPEFWFDAQDTLNVWPELVDDLIEKLTERLRSAGVNRAEIGRPRRPYAERAYIAEADWFHGVGNCLQPVDEQWLPPNFPEGLPVPPKARVVVAHEGRDGSWTHVAWRRRKPRDEFADVLAQWRAHGFVVEALTPIIHGDR